jgi:uncharacterized protein (TIGR02646 family)
MKGIVKNQEPVEFTTWKAQANDDWKPSYDKLQNPEKAIVRRALVEEQGYLCAYCCEQIEDSHKTTVIEHHEPQSKNPDRALAYDNLFACCDGQKQNDKGLIFYCCDEEKKDQYEDPNDASVYLLKPTEKNENDRFVCEIALGYTPEGAMIAQDSPHQKRAEFTIEVLNLDIEELRRRRANAIAFLFENQAESMFFDFTQEEIAILKNAYKMIPDSEKPKLEAYCNIISYFLEHYF